MSGWASECVSKLVCVREWVGERARDCIWETRAWTDMDALLQQELVNMDAWLQQELVNMDALLQQELVNMHALL